MEKGVWREGFWTRATGDALSRRTRLARAAGKAVSLSFQRGVCCVFSRFVEAALTGFVTLAHKTQLGFGSNQNILLLSLAAFAIVFSIIFFMFNVLHYFVIYIIVVIVNSINNTNLKLISIVVSCVLRDVCFNHASKYVCLLIRFAIDATNHNIIDPCYYE